MKGSYFSGATLEKQTRLAGIPFLTFQLGVDVSLPRNCPGLGPGPLASGVTACQSVLVIDSCQRAGRYHAMFVCPSTCLYQKL